MVRSAAGLVAVRMPVPYAGCCGYAVHACKDGLGVLAEPSEEGHGTFAPSGVHFGVLSEAF